MGPLKWRRSFNGPILFIIIPLSSLMVACTGTGIKEADREVLWQTKGAIVTARTTHDTGNVAVEKQALNDAESSTSTLLKNLGEPKNKVGYSVEESKKVQQDSDKEHEAVPWYAYIGMGMASLGGVLMTVIRFAPGLLAAVPVLGQIVTALTWASSFIENLRQDADAQADDKIHKDRIVELVQTMLESAPPILKNFLADKLKDLLLKKPNA